MSKNMENIKYWFRLAELENIFRCTIYNQVQQQQQQQQK